MYVIQTRKMLLDTVGELSVEDMAHYVLGCV